MSDLYEKRRTQNSISLIYESSKRGKYIASLEARIAELEAALDKAAHEMYEETGSCPSDLYDWEHPNTCIRECVKYEKPDEAWKCWRLWLMCPAPPEEQ